jgi:NAD(P)-dependent dehydrogenase (short-subunit alcohol dehydrogenase family)
MTTALRSEPAGGADARPGWAVVTGGGSGIGRSVCLELARDHPGIAVLDRNETAARQTAELVSEEAGVAALAIQVDVTDHADVERAVMAVPGETIASLVNCAGVREIRPFGQLTPDEYARVLAVNLAGPFHCIKAVYDRLLKPGGSVVTLSSVSGMMGVPERAAYCSSKHGVIGLTRALAHELGEAGIRINAVCPGVVETPMTASYFEDAAYTDRVRRAHPLGRWGTPDEVAALVGFLCGSRATFCTGGVYPVDGGFTSTKAM